jgi:hypothetical protein
MPEILTTAAELARFIARRDAAWQLAAMTPIEQGLARAEAVLRIEWHDGHGWGGEPRNIDGLAVTVRGVSRYSLAGPHEPGTTIGYLAAITPIADSALGLALGVPGDLEIVGASIEVSALPTRQEIAAVRLNPGRVTFDAPATWTWGEWRARLAAHGAAVELLADGVPEDDDRVVAAPGTAWALSAAGVAHDGAAGVWVQWRRGGAGTHATAIRQVRCPDSLWHAVRAVIGDLPDVQLTCGNARFDGAAWRAQLAR